MPDTRAPPRSRSAAPFSLPPPGWQVPGTDLNCSESTGWRGHRAAGREPEACGATDPVKRIVTASADTTARLWLRLKTEACDTRRHSNEWSRWRLQCL